ncbi:MAG: aminopeptidase [Bacteroidetes bacterium]|nr:aminopeptidase [Bacteroidota bacterium]
MKALDSNTLSEFGKSYQSKNRDVVTNAIIKNGLHAIAENRNAHQQNIFAFSNEIKTGKITMQGRSGRCWIFAGLNLLREKMAKDIEMKDFELSQTYHMFYDKLEKANYFLENIILTRKEKRDSRLVMWLLKDPIPDGGQWDMFVNLVEKYGVVPQNIMPETYHSTNTLLLNRLLSGKLREYAMHLRNASGESAAYEQKMAFMEEFYLLLATFLGEPPAKFNFEYANDNDEYNIHENITPQQFLKEYIKIDVSDYVSVINAPADDKPFLQSYTVDYLNNMVAGKPIFYMNVDNETLKNLTLKQLNEKEPVWFGCDVGKWSDRNSGVMDTETYRYDQVLDVKFDLSKGERLMYGDSLLTHAMLFTGVNLINGKPNRWKVENSWGEKAGNKGFFVMSDNWFNQFNYQVVVHKKYFQQDLLTLPDQEPIHLPPWDPMGSLALVQ